jgi:DNA-binding MarR family transcriptional regulator
MSMIDYEKNIFAHIFRVSNALQVYLDQQLKEDKLTAKQMFLMIVIGSFEEHQPTYKEAADRAGTSYQNIKLMALKLMQTGYIEILDDQMDKRAKRLLLTDQAKAYWLKRDMNDELQMQELFKDFDQKDLKQFYDYIIKMEAGLDGLSSKLKD